MKTIRSFSLLLIVIMMVIAYVLLAWKVEEMENEKEERRGEWS